MKNPVARGLIFRIVAFAAFAVAVVLGAISVGSGSQLLIVGGATLLTLAVVAAGTALRVRFVMKRAKRLVQEVADANPDAFVFRAAWSGAFLPPIVESDIARGGQPRGWGLVVCTSPTGIQFWRIGSKKLVDAGLVPWARVHTVTAQSVPAAIGTRTIPGVRFAIDPANTRLKSTVTVLPEKDFKYLPLPHLDPLISRILSYRPVAC